VRAVVLYIYIYICIYIHTHTREFGCGSVNSAVVADLVHWWSVQFVMLEWQWVQ
jgi:hypothetical protein